MTDQKQTFEEILKKAEKGDVEAQYQLGEIYTGEALF